MNEALLIVLPFVLLFLLLALGVPVAFALAASGFVALLIGFGLSVALGYLMTTPYREAAHYSLATLPLFLVMGYVASHSGITNSLFTAAYRWVGHLPGGLAQATIVAAAVFAAACGSSVASADTCPSSQRGHAISPQLIVHHLWSAVQLPTCLT